MSQSSIFFRQPMIGLMQHGQVCRQLAKSADPCKAQQQIQLLTLETKKDETLKEEKKYDF
jgi:hypothetical protein